MKRKRLITLLMFFCILAGNAWGGAVYFQKTLVELSTADLSSYSATDPDNSTTCYMFQQDVYWLYYVGANPINLGHFSYDDGNTWNNAEDKKDFDWVVKVNGNIDILCYNKKIDNSHSNDRYFLKTDADATAWNATKYGSHIYFKSSDGSEMHGSIEVTATNKDFEYPAGVHNAYTATYTIKINMDTKSTKWDFYSKHLNPTNSSVWEEEVVNGDDKLQAYNVEVTSATDLGSIISETAGLQFIAPKNSSYFTFGYKDPAPEGTTAVDERYIGLYQGATLIIPHSTWSTHTANKTRIRIKMGRFGGTGIRLTIGNGKDALGNAITGEGSYEIGGSVWWGSKGDNHQRGEYHFMVADQTADFTIKVEVGAGTWLKLYSIEVYESDNLITENSVLGNKYQLLNTGGSIGSSGQTGEYYLHYRGKAEGTKINATTISYTGNINTNDANQGFDVLSAASDAEFGSPKHTYTSKIGDFGTFGMTIGCYTHGVEVSGVTHSYCTDYASRRQSVGYMESKSYPYTWDFKDIWVYKFIGDRMSGGYHGEGWYQSNGGLHLWAATNGTDEFGLRVALDAGHDVMFCGGSQLWYGQTIIPETAGLAFTPVNFDNTYDYTLRLSANGLTFNQDNRDWYGWRVTIPSVPVGGAVYVRAKNAGTNASMRHVKYYIGSGVNNKTNMTEFAASAPANKIQVAGKDGEFIYAIYNNDASEAKDISLFFNGVEVQKIAVSTDKKTFNAKGWTTESRDHDIDPSLTAEMNGRGIKTFAVTDVKYDKKHVTMTDISNEGLMRAATDDSKYACILRNTADNTFEVVNGGFYLFVPDMHDEQGSTTGDGYKLKSYATAMESSVMKAKVNYAVPTSMIDETTYKSENNKTPIPAKSNNGAITNFAFTYQYYQLDDNGNRTTNEKLDGPQGFYRIAAGGAYSLGNQGYLPLETSKLSTDVVNSARGFELAFDDDEEGSEVTAIENIEASKSDVLAKGAVYYSLSGQQLSGKPAKGGIYICNGKKVIIK